MHLAGRTSANNEWEGILEFLKSPSTDCRISKIKFFQCSEPGQGWIEWGRTLLRLDLDP